MRSLYLVSFSFRFCRQQFGYTNLQAAQKRFINIQNLVNNSPTYYIRATYGLLPCPDITSPGLIALGQLDPINYETDLKDFFGMDELVSISQLRGCFLQSSQILQFYFSLMGYGLSIKN